jgi:hypothetical protein
MNNNPARLSKFMRLVKVDEAKRQAWGLATAETPDKSGEICDYEAAKAAYQKWSEEARKATEQSGQEISLGNVRLQHTMQPVGKVIALEYRDQEKEIFVGTYIDDEATWRQIKKGILTGFSHGGEYEWRKCNSCGTDMLGLGSVCPKCEEAVGTRYAPILAELSVVDNPCLDRAHFDYVKADGSIEVRTVEGSSGEIRRLRVRRKRSIKLAARTAENKGGILMSTEAKEMVRAAKKTVEEHLSKVAAHHQQLAKCHAELSQAHDEAAEKIAKCLDTGKGDDQVNQALYDLHKTAAEQHEQIAQEHEDQAEKCAKLAEGHDKEVPAKPDQEKEEDDQEADTPTEKAFLSSLVKAGRGTTPGLEKVARQWMVKMFEQALENASDDKEVNELFSRMAIARTSTAINSLPRPSTVKTFVPRGGEVQTIKIEAEETSECGL